MKRFIALLSGFAAVATAAAPVVSCTSQKWPSYILPLNKRNFKNTSNEPAFSYIPHTSDSTKNNINLNAWANDPVSTLYDEKTKTYYGWELFRDGRGFPSDWVEMTSPDLLHWTQGPVRIGHDSEFDKREGQDWRPAIVGGSVFEDKTGMYTGIKGALVFFGSIQPSAIVNKNKDGKKVTVGEVTGDCGIAYFVSEGFGKPIKYSGIVSNRNPYLDVKDREAATKEGAKFWNDGDFRDVFLFDTAEDKTVPDNQKGLYFGVTAGDRIEFWKLEKDALSINNSFNSDGTLNEEKIKEMDKRADFEKKEMLRQQENKEEPHNGFISRVGSLIIFDQDNGHRNGVEVPNIIHLKDGYWLVTCSIQDNPVGGGPYQSSWAYLCKWENGTFKPLNKLNSETFGAGEYEPYRLEYGTEGYAQRNNDINLNLENGSLETEIVSRSMPQNWVYNTDIWNWYGGALPTESIKVNIDSDDLKNSTVKLLPLNIPEKKYDENSETAIFNFKGSELANGITLKFSYGDFDIKVENTNKQSLPAKVYEQPKDRQVLTWNNKIDMGNTWKKWNNIGGDTDANDQIKIVWNATMITIYNVTKGWTAHMMLPQGIKLNNALEISKNVKSWDRNFTISSQDKTHDQKVQDLLK